MGKRYKGLLETVLLILIGGLIFSSCEDFVDIDPPRNEIVAEVVFDNDQTVNAALNGIYSRMLTAGDIFNTGLFGSTPTPSTTTTTTSGETGSGGLFGSSSS